MNTVSADTHFGGSFWEPGFLSSEPVVDHRLRRQALHLACGTQ